MDSLLDRIIDIGTLLAVLFAGYSAFLAAKAMKLQREAIRAQSFLDIVEYEKGIGFSKGMDTVRGLRDDECKDYRVFREREADKDEQIRRVVDFLNHLAHLIRNGYVTTDHMLVLYTASIEACRHKLLGKGKWLEGFRKYSESPKYYLNFECLCINLEKLWEGKKVNWPDPKVQPSKEMR